MQQAPAMVNLNALKQGGCAKSAVRTGGSIMRFQSSISWNAR
jgi:hypothetical protein